MTAGIITVLAVVAGIIWLGVLFVSAIRNRGGQEVPPNLRPGIDDEVLETRRLENGQKFAIAMSAFLAVSLPLYFLGEPARQEGFVEEFDEASVERGLHIVEEFACFDCHGPEGVGGVASFVEKRSGVTVAWAAPALNDVLYRYDEDELNFWITFGRGNTPMPPWGLAGGGPLNELQVVDVVNYLKTIQISQAEALAKVEPTVTVELGRLADADAIVENTILQQEQTVATIERSNETAPIAVSLAEEAREIFDAAHDGIDTDGDGLSDVAEVDLTELSAAGVEAFTIVDPIEMDPTVADAEKADEAVAQLEAGLEAAPILQTNLDAVNAAIEAGMIVPDTGLTQAALDELGGIRADADALGIDVPAAVTNLAEALALVASLEAATSAEEPVEGAAELATAATAAVEAGSDPDDDGIASGSEVAITNQMADANTKTIPPEIVEITLDPTNPETTTGVPDEEVASRYVGSVESLATQLSVTAENREALLAQQTAGLNFLLESRDARLWDVDFAGVAEAMGTSEEDAQRAVALFNANCARCHTASFPAGVPFSGPVGSGSFGPALWDGRPQVQFGDPAEFVEDDLLINFLIRGSEPETPYGINGFGSGRMPAFGAILSQADIVLLSHYLRAGNLNGLE